MEIDAQFHQLNIDYTTGNTLVTFTTRISPAKVESLIEPLKDKDTILSLKRKTKRRTKDANALMWACIQELADVQKPPEDKWSCYLRMLKKYGQYTYLLCDEEALDGLSRQWRELEIVGEVVINNQKKIGVLCFFGSHTYTVGEFSILLDGIIAEMVSDGLEPPMSEEVKASLERWEHEISIANK